MIHVAAAASALRPRGCSETNGMRVAAWSHHPRTLISWLVCLLQSLVTAPCLSAACLGWRRCPTCNTWNIKRCLGSSSG